MSEEEYTMSIADRASLLLSCDKQKYEEIASDVTIIADIRQFPVHSFILNIASPVLEKLVSKQTEGKIQINDVHPSIIEKVLRYIYADNFDVNGALEAMEIFMAAEKFELPHLQFLCNKHLNDCPVTSHNASVLFEISYKNGFPNILSKSAEWLFKKTNKFLEDDGLLCASYEIVEKLVKDTFLVDETLLISKILKWCSDECQRRNVTKREILESILPNILFLCLSNKEFADIVIPSNLLTMEEILAVSSNKNASESNRLPMPRNLSSEIERRQKYVPLNFHLESSVPEKMLSVDDVFVVVFRTEKDCFVEGLVLPVIFDPLYQLIMKFQITLTDLQSGIKYKIPYPVNCDVHCEISGIATFNLPCSLFIKKKTPMKLKVKNLINPVINMSSSYEPHRIFILKTSKRKGMYEWYGKPLAYIYNAEVKGFQISGLLLTF